MTERQRYDGPPADLANASANGFQLTAYCRKCWHRGPTRTPEEWAEAFGVPMSAYMIEMQKRLKCSDCGRRTGYFHIENPAVRPHAR